MLFYAKYCKFVAPDYEASKGKQKIKESFKSTIFAICKTLNVPIYCQLALKATIIALMMMRGALGWPDSASEMFFEILHIKVSQNKVLVGVL